MPRDQVARRIAGIQKQTNAEHSALQTHVELLEAQHEPAEKNAGYWDTLVVTRAMGAALPSILPAWKANNPSLTQNLSHTDFIFGPEFVDRNVVPAPPAAGARSTSARSGRR